MTLVPSVRRAVRPIRCSTRSWPTPSGRRHARAECLSGSRPTPTSIRYCCGGRSEKPGIDFRTATAAGLAGVDDAAVLAIAAQDQRILVTHDQTTMPTHFGEFTRSKPVQDSSSFHRVSRSEKRPTR